VTGRWSTRPVLRMLAAGLLAVAVMAAGVMMGLSDPLLQAAEQNEKASARGAKTAQAPPKQGAPAGKAQPASPPQPEPKPAQIDRNGVLILVRTTLLALDQANKTGNYTVLRDLGSPEFQINSAARLAEIFVQQRRDNIDLAGVAVIDPQLTLLPQIEANGMMRMAGFFPSVPTQVNFELAYAPMNGRWRLFGLSVSLGQAAPVAPSPPPIALLEGKASEAQAVLSPATSKTTGQAKQ
jgi:hypothetical protein